MWRTQSFSNYPFGMMVNYRFSFTVSLEFQSYISSGRGAAAVWPSWQQKVLLQTHIYTLSVKDIHVSASLKASLHPVLKYPVPLYIYPAHTCLFSTIRDECSEDHRPCMDLTQKRVPPLLHSYLLCQMHHKVGLVSNCLSYPLFFLLIIFLHRI